MVCRHRFQSLWLVAGLAAAAILTLSTPAWSQPPDVPEPTGGLFGPPAGMSGGASDTVEAKAVVHPAGGNLAELAVTATIKPGYHIYSITQPPGGPVRTKIKLDPSDKFRLAGEFKSDEAPHAQPEAAFDNLTVESHEGSVTWRAPIELAPGVNANDLTVKGQVAAQPCDANSCLPPSDFPFTSSVGPAVVLASAPATPEVLNSPPAGNSVRDMSLFLAIVFGFIGGLILNIMPCVLPVIGLKILSFIEQSKHDRVQTLTLNLWYSAGLVSVFVLLATLATFAKLGWGELFAYQEFSIAMAAVVFIMALSFLGVWDVPIPGFVGRGKATKLASREGAAGAFSKGVLTTILATPCSAPYLASVLVWVVTQPAAYVYAVFISMGLGMASPYLLIGAFPELLRFLPKPGQWMETFKQVMGFVLLGTVVFLLSFLAFPTILPTVALLFGLWGSCWWIGRMSPLLEPSAKARTWVEAVAFAGVVWLIAFRGAGGLLPEPIAFGSLADYMQGRFDRAHERFSQENLERLVNSNRTVLVDFTADWCLSCKALEKAVLHSDKVQEAIQANKVVMLRADWTAHDAEVTAMLERLGSKQVPVIAVFPAGRFDQPIVFRGGYTQQSLVEAIEKAGRSKM
jgi:thiol:disulfide interchange protein DsbD